MGLVHVVPAAVGEVMPVLVEPVGADLADVVGRHLVPGELIGVRGRGHHVGVAVAVEVHRFDVRAPSALVVPLSMTCSVQPGGVDPSFSYQAN